MIHKEKSLSIGMIISLILWVVTSATLSAKANEQTITKNQPKDQQHQKPQLELGGALRFNYNYSDWKPANKKRGGDFGFDLFRLNAKASYKQLMLDAEYRFYAASSGGGMLKHGWVGYKFDDSHQIQLGLTGVPFGIQPYSSNSFFFNINYYLGLEDDSDMGIKYCYASDSWTFAAAFFKNADQLDFGSSSETSPSRYAYDVSGRNKEVNQGNLQLIRRWGNSIRHQLGVSAMYGGLYNLDTEKMGSHYALALHYVLDYENWNLKVQYTNRELSPANKDGDSRTVVEMGAFGANYHTATRFDTYMASLAYTFHIDKGVLNSVQLYNDFSVMDKRESGYKNSLQNITGCLLDMKPVYVYVDYAMGNNHAWLGPQWDTAFANGASGRWSTRFNINFGYYF